MARPKIKRKGLDWKELLSADKDMMKAAVQEIVQEVLEAEMEEIVGARKSERSADPQRIPKWLLHARVDNPGWQTRVASPPGPRRPIQHGSL